MIICLIQNKILQPRVLLQQNTITNKNLKSPFGLGMDLTHYTTNPITSASVFEETPFGKVSQTCQGE